MKKGLPLLPTAKRPSATASRAKPGHSHYVLRLFVSGTTPRSARAIRHVRALCDQCLPGNYDLEVIDIYQQPALARREQIIATPTLIRKAPLPEERRVGDLSNRAKIRAQLDLPSSRARSRRVTTALVRTRA